MNLPKAKEDFALVITIVYSVLKHNKLSKWQYYTKQSLELYCEILHSS